MVIVPSQTKFWPILIAHRETYHAADLTSELGVINEAAISFEANR